MALRGSSQHLSTLHVTCLFMSGHLEVSTVEVTPGHCVLCRIDTTRVEFTVPLRENWALPFFAVQTAAVTYFLRPNLQPLSEVSLVLHVILVPRFSLRSLRKWDLPGIPMRMNRPYPGTGF